MSYKRFLPALAIWAVLVAVAAAAPMKALIVDGQNNHKWQVTTPPLQKLLEETGLFTVDVATTPPRGQDMSGFAPKFADYDLVVCNYTGDSWPEETNVAFEKYVADGGGVVIFHAASNAFAKWKEYNEIIGVGGWGGRDEKDGPFLHWLDGKIVRDMTPARGGTHGPQHAFQLIVREPDHPITKGLPEKFMHSPDELYSTLRGPAKNLTVLATAFADKEKRGTGRHEPILMTITYGKGRVFHTTLGHIDTQLKSVAYIVTYQRGAEWAATGKVTQEIPDDFPGPDEPSMRE
ncbi:MAG: ThuA domain-containing protein [Thermoguttaceae bacterium]